MERKKWWAGLIAVAMGLAFSVGSASAYETGDFAAGNAANSGKLVPYYTAGSNLATIIGVENQAGFGSNTVGAGTDNVTNTAASGQVSIIEVRVLSAMGAVQAVGQLCLKSNQFGYAIIKEYMMMDDDMMDKMQVVLMVGVGDQTAMITGMPGDQTVTGVDGRAGSSKSTDTGDGSGIASMGYVVVHDLGTFSTDQTQEATDMNKTNDGCDSQGTPNANTNSKFAAWTILQDVGEGSFFGTEIPTVTVATSETITGENADKDRINSAAAGCGGDNCRGLVRTVDSDDSNVMVAARFDNNMDNDSMSMVYVWMDSHVGFMGNSGNRLKREVTAMVYCEGAAAAQRMKLDLPDRSNMVYGSKLGCDARGVVMIPLPDAPADADSNTAGEPTGAVVWSHISQVGGGFRMNFTGVETVPSG